MVISKRISAQCEGIRYKLLTGYKGEHSNFGAEEPNRHLNQEIKVKRSNIGTNQHCTPPSNQSHCERHSMAWLTLGPKAYKPKQTMDNHETNSKGRHSAKYVRIEEQNERLSNSFPD